MLVHTLRRNIVRVVSLGSIYPNCQTHPTRFPRKTAQIGIGKRTYSCSKVELSRGRKFDFSSRPKGTLIKMKIDESALNQLKTPELLKLAELFSKYGYELRFAGGIVRDLLAGNKPGDIDFATTATPEEMKAMFEKEGIRMINRKGESHGTVTARIDDKENFEVTTLRIDLVTDGRHAEVEFTKNWELDAGRRDLTVNSMFLDLDGTVYDYFNGAEDLKNRRVRFVGNAELRIQEDYLRILRYFRFFGRISLSPDNHEEDNIIAISKNVAGLERISGERLWMELKKILSGNYAANLMLKILDVGVGKYIGLPDNPNISEFSRVTERAARLNISLHPITMLSALLYTDEQGMNLHKRLRLSVFERDLCLFLILHRNSVVIGDLKPLERLLLLSKSKSSDVKLWIEELLKYIGDVDMLKAFQNLNIPKFPVSGHALVERNVPAGRSMNTIISHMKDAWIDSDYKLSQDDLLNLLPDIMERHGIKLKSK